jgi:hypothetical protein
LVANLEATGQTNPQSNTCINAQCDCNIIWSLAQQFAMRQISNYAPAHHGVPDYRNTEHSVSGTQPGNAQPEFVSNYAVRARRIASAYARMYLEKFPLGDTKKVGRFYWMGLGAFAAKQVAVTLEKWQVRTTRWSELYEGLGNGNLWLFNDVLPWHYGYAVGVSTFSQCATTRDSRQFVAPVVRNMSNQKGYAKSIDKVPYEIDGDTGKKKAKLGYLQHTSLIQDGFKKVSAWESATDTDKPAIALSHLICIAQHEQGEVLQGLIYDDPSFARWLDVQRDALATSDGTAINNSMDAARHGLSDGSDIAIAPVIRALVPNLELVLASDDGTDNPDFLSVAPDRIVLQDYQKRMLWINGVARKYHGLMQGHWKQHMLTELGKIAEWERLADKP